MSWDEQQLQTHLDAMAAAENYKVFNSRVVCYKGMWYGLNDPRDSALRPLPLERINDR